MSGVPDDVWESDDCVRRTIVLPAVLAERLADRAERRGLSISDLLAEYAEEGLRRDVAGGDDRPLHRRDVPACSSCAWPRARTHARAPRVPADVVLHRSGGLLHARFIRFAGYVLRICVVDPGSAVDQGDPGTPE